MCVYSCVCVYLSLCLCMCVLVCASVCVCACLCEGVGDCVRERVRTALVCLCGRPRASRQSQPEGGVVTRRLFLFRSFLAFVFVIFFSSSDLRFWSSNWFLRGG